MNKNKTTKICQFLGLDGHGFANIDVKQLYFNFDIWWPIHDEEPVVVDQDDDWTAYKDRIVCNNEHEVFPKSFEHVPKCILYQPLSHYRFAVTSSYARNSEVPDSNLGCMKVITGIIRRVGFPQLNEEEKERLFNDYNMQFEFPECNEETLSNIPEHQLFNHVRT